MMLKLIVFTIIVLIIAYITIILLIKTIFLKILIPKTIVIFEISSRTLSYNFKLFIKINFMYNLKTFIFVKPKVLMQKLRDQNAEN